MDKVETTLSRRKLLLVIGGATAAAGAVIAAPYRGVFARRVEQFLRRRPLARTMRSLAYGSYEDWLLQVGSDFAIAGAGTMRLIGVQAFASGGRRPPELRRSSAFVAFFDPLGGRTLAGELIYTLRHPQHGPLQLFLSASADPQTPARMFAVLN